MIDTKKGFILERTSAFQDGLTECMVFEDTDPSVVGGGLPRHEGCRVLISVERYQGRGDLGTSFKIELWPHQAEALYWALGQWRNAHWKAHKLGQKADDEPPAP